MFEFRRDDKVIIFVSSMKRVKQLSEQISRQVEIPVLPYYASLPAEQRSAIIRQFTQQ